LACSTDFLDRESDISDFLIVGGGVIGLLIGKELAQAGAQSHSKWIKASAGRGFFGGGVSYPPFIRGGIDQEDLRHWLKEAQRCYPELVEALLMTPGIDP